VRHAARLVKSERSFYIGEMPRVSQDHLDSRRQQILDAARRCFARNGFHATSMQDVLAEAKLSAGAVYRYFKGKDDIIVAIATTAVANVAGAFESVTHEDPPPSLPEVFERVFTAIEDMDPDGDLAKTVVQVWGEALRSPVLFDEVTSRIGSVFEVMEETVKLYQDRGIIDPDVPAARAARVLISTLPGFLLQRALFGDVNAKLFAEGLRALLPRDGSTG